MFALPRLLPVSFPVWNRLLGAAAVALAACGGGDATPGPDAAPPGPPLERLAGDVCGQLNRSVTASFMHEGVIYLGCTGGALGSAWVRYDTVTGQRETIDDVVGSAFCGVTKRDVTLTYTQCAIPTSTPDIYQRAITQTGLGPPVRVFERAPTTPSFFAETDRTFYLVGYDSNRGMLALWHLVRSDFELPTLQVALHFESGISVRDIIGGPEGLYLLEDSLGSTRLRYRPENALDQAVDVVQQVGFAQGWFDRYRGQPTWFSDHDGDLQRWTLNPGYAQPNGSSGCPLNGPGVRAGDLIVYSTTTTEGGPDCGDRVLSYDLDSLKRRATVPVGQGELTNLSLVGADDTSFYGLDTKDEYTADLVRIRTEPL